MQWSGEVTDAHVGYTSNRLSLKQPDGEGAVIYCVQAEQIAQQNLQASIRTMEDRLQQIGALAACCAWSSRFCKGMKHITGVTLHSDNGGRLMRLLLLLKAGPQSGGVVPGAAETEREQAEAHQVDVKEKLRGARDSLAAKQKESKLLEQSRRQAGCVVWAGLLPPYVTCHVAVVQIYPWSHIARSRGELQMAPSVVFNQRTLKPRTARVGRPVRSFVRV